MDAALDAASIAADLSANLPLKSGEHVSSLAPPLATQSQVYLNLAGLYAHRGKLAVGIVNAKIAVEKAAEARNGKRNPNSTPKHNPNRNLMWRKLKKRRTLVGVVVVVYADIKYGNTSV